MIQVGAGLLLGVLLTLAGLVLGLVVLSAGARLVRVRRELRVRRREDAARPHLYALMDGESPKDLDARGLAALDVLALGLLPQLRGADRENLHAFLQSRGVLARARARTRSRSSARRAEAAELLGAAGDRAARPVLARLLLDRDVRVRICAARALGRLGGVSAVQPLLARVGSVQRPLPGGIVSMSLLRIGAPAAPVLRFHLLSPDPALRSMCAALLGHLGDLAAARPLIHMLATEPDRATAVAAVAALGRIGTPEATPALLRVLDGAAWPDVRAAAATALGAIGDPAAVEALVEARHDAVEVAAAAAAAVAVMHSELLPA